MSSSTSPVSTESESVNTYEIGFDGDVGELVQRVTPSARVLCTPISTVLWHHLQLQKELDVMLDALSSVGITPSEVHESLSGARVQRQEGEHPYRLDPESHPVASTYCEVRIDGRLGDAILAHLRWSNRVVQTTVVRAKVSYGALCAFLAEMSSATRVHYVLCL